MHERVKHVPLCNKRTAKRFDFPISILSLKLRKWRVFCVVMPLNIILLANTNSKITYQACNSIILFYKKYFDVQASENFPLSSTTFLFLFNSFIVADNYIKTTRTKNDKNLPWSLFQNNIEKIMKYSKQGN